MRYLLDTNVLSELRKGQACHKTVKAWAGSTRNERHYISVLSLGEIRKGIEILRQRSPKQCPAFEKWLAQLQTDYSTDILSITEPVNEAWGHLMAERTLPVIDGLLAATALTYGLTVATRNTAEFEGTGATVVNPFV